MEKRRKIKTLKIFANVPLLLNEPVCDPTHSLLFLLFLHSPDPNLEPTLILALLLSSSPLAPLIHVTLIPIPKADPRTTRSIPLCPIIIHSSVNLHSSPCLLQLLTSSRQTTTVTKSWYRPQPSLLDLISNILPHPACHPFGVFQAAATSAAPPSPWLLSLPSSSDQRRSHLLTDSAQSLHYLYPQLHYRHPSAFSWLCGRQFRNQSSTNTVPHTSSRSDTTATATAKAQALLWPHNSSR